MTVPVVFCADANYGQYVPVVVQSIIENSSLEYKYHIIILDCGFKSEDLAVLARQIAAHENFSIEVKPVLELLQKYKIKKGRRLQSPAMLGRLLIPELCAEYSKVIYADMDMIFNQDMSGLMAIDLGDNYLAAVIDIDVEAERFLTDPRAKESEAYINSGLMVMNLQAWREHRLADKARQFLVDGRDGRFLDQDAINAVCRGRILFLNEAWNSLIISRKWVDQHEIALRHKFPYLDKILSDYLIAYQDDKKNLHWTGRAKPWLSFNVPFAEEWWRYARKVESCGRLLEAVIRNRPGLFSGCGRVLYKLLGLPLLLVETEPQSRQYYLLGFEFLRVARSYVSIKYASRSFYLLGLKVLTRRNKS